MLRGVVLQSVLWSVLWCACCCLLRYWTSCVWLFGAVVRCVGGLVVCCRALLFAALFLLAPFGAMCAVSFGAVLYLVAVSGVWRCAVLGDRSCVLLTGALLCRVLLCCGGSFAVVRCCVLSSSVLCLAAIFWSGLLRSVVWCVVPWCVWLFLVVLFLSLWSCCRLLPSPLSLRGVRGCGVVLLCGGGCGVLWCSSLSCALCPCFVALCRPPLPSVRCLVPRVGAYFFLGICWRVCLPGAVFSWHASLFVSFPGRVAGRPAVWCVGVVSCGVLLPALCPVVLICLVVSDGNETFFAKMK